MASFMSLRITSQSAGAQKPSKMKRGLLRIVFMVMVAAFVAHGCNNGGETTKAEEVNLRLQWTPYSQFAGFILALQNGYYKDEGVDVKLLAGGPDLKPHVTVANGTDQFGVGVPNQVITARANGVPLVVVAQFFQDSPN